MEQTGSSRTPRRQAAGSSARLGSLWLGLAVLAVPASAHDVWLEPADFRPRPGETVGIQVMVGEAFLGESVPRRPSRIGAFWIAGADGREMVRGVDGASPAGLVRLPSDASGWRTVLYESLPASVELAHRRFVDHLRLEGLGELADRLGAEGPAVREVYSRCSTSLLAIGSLSSSSGPPPVRPEGCAIVLWPAEAPRGAGPVALELTLGGRPVSRALVRAYRKDDESAGSTPVEGRTDADGRVVLDLRAAGTWMVKTLVIEPAGPADGEAAAWRSWWASLTLALDGT